MLNFGSRHDRKRNPTRLTVSEIPQKHVAMGDSLQTESVARNMDIIAEQAWGTLLESVWKGNIASDGDRNDKDLRVQVEIRSDCIYLI